MQFPLLSLLLAVAGATGDDAAGWPRGDAAEAGLSATRLQDLDAAIRAAKYPKVGSVAIARHGRLVHEAYFDGDARTLRDTRSATKSITSVLVGMAIGAHALGGVDARVLALLPDRARRAQSPSAAKDRMTVEDLLTMSSPLECDDWNDASRGNEERMYVIEDWAQFFVDLPLRGRMHVGRTPASPPYGRWFSYCTAGVFLLGEVLQRATGMPADVYAEKKLFAPLGIARAEWVYSPTGAPQTGGGLRLATVDLLEIAQLYLNGGTWNGARLVDEAWVQTSTRPHARIDEHTEYGYLWWLESFAAGGVEHRAFLMSGNGGNKVVGIPSLDLAVAITSTNYNTRGMHEVTDKLLVEVLGAVSP